MKSTKIKRIIWAVLLIVVCMIIGCKRKEESTSKETKDDKKTVVYRITCGSGYILPGMKESDMKALAGEPMVYNEIKSCAYEGMDYVYTYSGFVSYVNEIKGEKKITKIVVYDDTVKLAEGIAIGSSRSLIEGKLKKPDSENNGYMIYQGKNSVLKIGMKDGKAISIEISYEES